MADLLSGKMKWKGLDEVSDFSLSSPARKIRRLVHQGFWKVRAEQTEKSGAINNSLTVVPWVPSNVQVGTMKESDLTNPSFEPVEADEELATVEVEEETGYVGGDMDFANVNDIVGAGVNRVDDLKQQQWQQQHCLIPNIPPPNSSIPIT